MTKKNLREDMPGVAGIIDILREVYGAKTVNDMIRAGLDGQPVFWARENGIEIGTKPRNNALNTPKEH